MPQSPFRSRRSCASAGYSTFIQDQDFGNTNFMANMADAFAMVERGARVIAAALAATT